MKGKLAWSVVTILFVIIIVLTWILFAVPAPAHAPTVPVATTTPAQTGTPSENQPLHTRVVVSSPVTNAKVGQNFTIKGEAPGNWYFEATFPIQVRDNENSKIGQTVAQAQGDWMTTAQVPFTATVTLSVPYHGPATLVLSRDNPSGLPENDDSLEVPIVIQ